MQQTFTEAEYKHISNGFIPEAMEDKWFIFLEGDVLYFHRSWTGSCVYQLRLQKEGVQYTIVEALVSRDPNEYSGTEAEYDQRMLIFLIASLLLGQPARFPRPDGLPAGIATEIYQHHAAGRGPIPEKEVMDVRWLGRWVGRWLLWLIRG
jgi:hypothetical protein